MRDLTIGVVAEGPTDYVIIEALIQKFVPGEHNFLLLQPEGSATAGFGTRGGGWPGVQRFCELIPSEFGGLQAFMSKTTPHMDILVIHLDGDVAREKGIACFVEGPDIIQTSENLKEKILGWLKADRSDQQVVFCIPFDNSETWVLCAFDVNTDYHNPPEHFLEWLEKPEWIISHQAYRKPKRILKRDSGTGKPKKSQRKYSEEIVPVILQNWVNIRAICVQANAFEQDFINAVSRL